MGTYVPLAIVFLMTVGFIMYNLVDSTLDAPPVVYRTAAVEEVGTVPNKKQEAACAAAGSAQGNTTHGPIRPVTGIVLSDPLRGGVGTSHPDLELARNKLNLAVAGPGQDLPLLIHGIPDRHTQVGDTLHFCGAFAGETFLWPLISYQERSWSFWTGQRGGPEYGPPDDTRYQRVLWVADLAPPRNAGG